MKDEKCNSCGKSIEGVYYEVEADRRIRLSDDRWSLWFYAVICEGCYMEKVATIVPEDKR